MVELQDRVLAPLGPLSIFAVAEIVVTAQQQPQPQQQSNQNCSQVDTKSWLRTTHTHTHAYGLYSEVALANNALKIDDF